MNSGYVARYEVEIKDEHPSSLAQENNNEEKRHEMETINLNNELISSESSTILSAFLAYIDSFKERNEISTILTKLANNQIQFTLKGKEANFIIDWSYFQAISTYATQELADLRSEVLNTSFIFEDELEEIFKLGVRRAVNFKEHFEKLNKHIHLLSCQNRSAAISDLKECIVNITNRIEQEFDKAFPDYFLPTFFQPARPSKFSINNEAAKKSLLSAMATSEEPSLKQSEPPKSWSCCSLQ